MRKELVLKSSKFFLLKEEIDLINFTLQKKGYPISVKLNIVIYGVIFSILTYLSICFIKMDYRPNFWDLTERIVLIVLIVCEWIILFLWNTASFEDDKEDISTILRKNRGITAKDIILFCENNFTEHDNITTELINNKLKEILDYEDTLKSAKNNSKDIDELKYNYKDIEIARFIVFHLYTKAG
ncbi:hypothetical protein NZD88_20970 [Chryseobacterium antibioticum]|uniref:SMODS and SLOG-associating 2TM effector domain-containing protein n=1 Tax=Chryseobacterium pyrolae TaxID=2987481 RepID=A0ABT2IMZ8_9FLAO|nr:hypothetical protein [Chryseobacterium pyrolae]MCT2410036.1 hypothetical protein [Chryseobacterium pyrolae]